MNNGLKVQRCNSLPEGEVTIIKDSNTLIHNIVDSELKQKNKEIERLNNIIDKAIEYNKENKKFANEVENRYAEEICKNNLEILGDKE